MGSLKESRRDFIKKSTLGVGGLAMGLSATTAKSYSRIQGANDRIHVAFIGCGRRVGAYYDSLSEPYNTELAYICDVKRSRAEGVAEALAERISYSPAITDDIREVLNDPQVDAIFNATPDHWHTPGSIMAMEADKHVYVEKPCSHNPAENELLVAAQRRYNKVVQMGNQTRSGLHAIEIVNDIHDGVIGDPYKAVAFYTNSRGRVPNPVEQAPPEDLNWDLFQGPAPREAYRHNTWDYNWHWYGWKYGTAETGNNATHELDIARWAMQVDYPQHVFVESAKQHFLDDGWTMYDSMYATFEYPDDKVITWDGQSRNGFSTYGSGRGTIIYGREGTVYVDREEYRLYDRNGDLVRRTEAGGTESGTALGGGGDMSTLHVVNFFETIRGTGDYQHAPIDDAAISVHLCHLANIASRTGKAFDVSTTDGRIYDRDAMKLWSRDYEPGWEPKV